MGYTWAFSLPKVRPCFSYHRHLFHARETLVSGLTTGSSDTVIDPARAGGSRGLPETVSECFGLPLKRPLTCHNCFISAQSSALGAVHVVSKASFQHHLILSYTGEVVKQRRQRVREKSPWATCTRPRRTSGPLSFFAHERSTAGFVQDTRMGALYLLPRGLEALL